MATHEELRAVSDRYFNGYMYPLAAWAIGLLFLFAAGRTPFALWLCYPLTVWYGGLTAAWATGALQRWRAKDLTASEAFAGARSIARFLASASLAPAVVFMTIDPLSPATWGTCAGVAAVAGVTWAVGNWVPRIRRRPAAMIALIVAWLALPINATGAVSLASALGWFRAATG